MATALAIVPTSTVTQLKKMLEGKLADETKLYVVAGALKNASTRYTIADSEVERLGYALSLSDMTPSRALANLKTMSALVLATALEVRFEFEDEENPPSIPMIAEAIERTGCPTDGSASDIDIEALLHDMVNICCVGDYHVTRETAEGFERETRHAKFMAYHHRGWGDD